MGAKIYVIAGGSCSGKTTLLNLIKKETLLNAAIPAKYSNRIKRDENDDVISVTEDINSSDYSFVYSMQDNFYGFKIEEIIDAFKRGKNVFLILSDIRVIEEIRTFFGEFVSVLYLFRNMSEFEFERILKERNEEHHATNSKIRKNRLYLIQRQYIENIHLFDNVILNRSEKPEEMLLQVNNIVNTSSKSIVSKTQKGPVIFLIAAASGAGKHTLMEAMYSLGSKSIKVIPKETDRPAQPEDGKEIIAGIKNLDNKYQISYEFDNKHYGIDDKIIWDNLKYGLPQIVITNMQQFSKFRAIFGNSIVNIYLHATRTDKELYEHQLKKLDENTEKAKSKVIKLEKVHQDYINNIDTFHHVLLNTIEKEDLWDQMFRLIKIYKT